MLSQPDVNQIFESNKESKYVETFSKLPYTKQFCQSKSENYPQYYVYEQLLIAENNQTTYPDDGTIFKFKIPNLDFLTGLCIKLTLTTDFDNTVLTSNNTSAIFWKKMNIKQYGNIIYTVTPSYILTRVKEALEPGENEYLESLILGAALNVNTQTYYLPIYGPMFDKHENYLLLDFYKNLEVELVFNRINISGNNTIDLKLMLYRMSVKQEFKNSYIENISKEKFMIPWYSIRSSENILATIVTNYKLYIDNFLTIKKIHLSIYNFLTGANQIITNISFIIGDKVIFNDDNTSNILKKYYSPNRKIFFGNNDPTGYTIPFGDIMDNLGLTNALCLSMGPFCLSIDYITNNANCKLYTNMQYNTQLISHPNDGSLLMSNIY